MAVPGRVPEQGQLCLSPFSGRHGRCGWEPGGPRGPMPGGMGLSLTRPGPSPGGGAPAETGCSVGRPVLALEPRRAPDHRPRMSPGGAHALVVGVLTAGAGWFSHRDAERVPVSALTSLPMAPGKAACPPPMLTPPRRQTPRRERESGGVCARCPQEGRSDSGCPQGHRLSASTLSFSSRHLTVERKGHLCSPSFQEHTAAPGSWQPGPRCGGVDRPGGRPHCPLKPSKPEPPGSSPQPRCRDCRARSFRGLSGGLWGPRPPPWPPLPRARSHSCGLALRARWTGLGAKERAAPLEGRPEPDPLAGSWPGGSHPQATRNHP